MVSSEGTGVGGRASAVLLGTALGDAMGLPTEGLSARVIARRFRDLDRYHLLGSTGFVSDDTEQSALLATALIANPDDPEACAAAFRRSLLAWFARLPWGIGLATLRACGRASVGLRPSGVPSAGNGAAMRSAILGVAFATESEKRRTFGRALAEVTHTDPRAVAGALFSADLAAELLRHVPEEAVERAMSGVTEPRLASALENARDLAARNAPVTEAAQDLGCTGYVLHTIPLAVYFLLRSHDQPLGALKEIIRVGGDTDTNAAVLGGWLGALHGETALPQALVSRIHNGPFGPAHLRAIGTALERRVAGVDVPAPTFSAPSALFRNLALMPVILAHGFRRLVP